MVSFAKTSRVGNSSKTISYEDLSAHFHLPINDVAKKLGMCVTVLKQRCRENGIDRWPYRKVRKLDKLISVMEESSDQVVSKKLCFAKETREYLRSNPNSTAHLAVGRVKANRLKSSGPSDESNIFNLKIRTRSDPTSTQPDSPTYQNSATSTPSFSQQESMDTSVYHPVPGYCRERSGSVTSSHLVRDCTPLSKLLHSPMNKNLYTPQPCRVPNMLIQSETSAFQVINSPTLKRKVQEVDAADWNWNSVSPSLRPSHVSLVKDNGACLQEAHTDGGYSLHTVDLNLSLQSPRLSRFHNDLNYYPSPPSVNAVNLATCRATILQALAEESRRCTSWH